MIIKLIFAILCGILYVIGLPFGLNYEQTSVYICIYLWPLLCVACALFTTYKAIKKKKTTFIVVNSIISVLYILITVGIFAHYSRLSVHEQFNDCMWKLYGLSDHLGISYEAVNLLIYVVLFSLIVLFHLMEVLVMDGKIKKRKKMITTEG
jgi:hypothetical protein